MKRQTKAEKAVDLRVERAYGQACSGIQIPLLDIPKVFRVGRDAVAAGADDETLKQKLRAFAESIRKN